MPASPIPKPARPPAFFEAVPWGRIVLYFLASRLFILGMGILSSGIIKQGEFAASKHVIDMFRRWDSGWYLKIAGHGYFYSTTQTSSVAFFPLYPLLVYLGSYLFHDLRISGYVISNALLLASSVVLWKLIRREDGREAVADRTLFFFLFCPVSFFFSTLYSESLFFFLLVTIAYLAAERRWLAAGCCGCLIALSRPVGILLTLFLAAEYLLAWWEKRRTAGRHAPWTAQLPERTPAFLLSLALTACGLAAYVLFLWGKFGEPLAFLKAEAFWGKHLVPPWEILWDHAAPFSRFYREWFYGATYLTLFLIVAGLGLRIRASYSLFSIVFFLLYISTSLLDSVPRFYSVLFPLYFVLALIVTRWPRLEPFFQAGTGMLLAFATVLFVNGYWFT